LILAAWMGVSIASAAMGRVLAIDAGTVGLVSAGLSFIGAIVVAYMNGRGSGRGRRPDRALVAALADTQFELEATRRERDKAREDLAAERKARAADLRALARARGLEGAAPERPARRRRPPKR